MNLRRIVGRAAPGLFGILLFALNQAPVFLAYLAPPAGYAGSLLPMHMDFLQYRTWINAYQGGSGWLLPDYHAPWLTEPALMNPFCWFVGRTGAALGIDGLWIYYLLSLALTVAGVYALIFTIRAFTQSRTQARTALLLSACCVPIPAILALPTFLFGRANPWLDLIRWAGKVLGRFSSDGFFNGVCAGPLVLCGTVTTILCMGLLAKYLTTNSPRYLRWASLIAGIGAFVHPFEIFVFMGAGSLALLMRRNRQWSRSIREVAIMVLPGLLGFAPYAYLSSRHPWLRQAAVENRWQALSPPMLLMLLGFPALFCLVSYLLPLGKKSVTDTLLHCWFAVVLVGVYIPYLPWQHHLLDGVNYAIALLMARQAARWAFVRNLAAVRPALARTSLIVLAALSLAVHALYWNDAVEAERNPGGDGSAVVSKTDSAVLSWLRAHASAGDLVLAPKSDAGWFATAPMHSFGSHWLFSLTWEEQVRLSDDFFKGSLDDDAARRLLTDFGVRYVVIANGSPAARYFSSQDPAASIEKATIYRMPNAGMRPYAVAMQKRP
jgi:hypothetical protein